MNVFGFWYYVSGLGKIRLIFLCSDNCQSWDIHLDISKVLNFFQKLGQPLNELPGKNFDSNSAYSRSRVGGPLGWCVELQRSKSAPTGYTRSRCCRLHSHIKLLSSILMK